MAMAKKQIQEYQDKKNVIEEETLKSTAESLRLLQETHKCGVATAEELNRQGEQLRSIDKQLDNINTTLLESQKNINGMKSKFSGLKNLFGKKNKDGFTSHTIGNDVKVSSTHHPALNLQNNKTLFNNLKESNTGTQQITLSSNFETKLNENMNEMSKSISVLKLLATDMGKELCEQDELIDLISTKTEQADCSIHQQNNQLKKMLGK